jgi:hypothetical protein
MKTPSSAAPPNEDYSTLRHGEDNATSSGSTPPLSRESTRGEPSPEMLVDLAEKIQNGRARRKVLIGGESIGEARLGSAPRAV